MIPQFAKRLGLAVGAAMAGPAVARRVLRNRATIFMLHRFRDRDLGLHGHDPEALRRSLDYLRRHGYQLVGLEELFRRFASAAEGIHGVIAFTMDDGYADQASIGAPIFAEFDCPVTMFVTTGFLDGTMWFWWDRVTYIFSRTPMGCVRLRLGVPVLEYRWSNVMERQEACRDVTERCKLLSEDAKERAINSLASEAGVALPAHAPAEYAPMSWEDVRRCEARGISFGPHTVTHPVLSRTDDQQSEYEIVESWRRLRAKVCAPAPVFCYPNGQPGDYGEREIRTLARIGLLASVVGTPGYARADAFVGDAKARFLIPRYQWPEGVPVLVQYASGLERLKQLIVRRA